MLDDILRNMNLFVDGQGYAGNIEEIVLPKLTRKVEEFRNGGMDAPIDVDLGMEKLETEFMLTQFDRAALNQFGLAPGLITPLTARGAILSDDGTLTPVVVTMRGIVREVDYGTWKSGEKATLKFMITLRYYKLMHGDNLTHEVDVINMVRIINGVDQLSAQRAALGI